MLKTLLILLFIRPFISSLAFPYANFLFSFVFFGFLALWIMVRGVPLGAFRKVQYPLALLIVSLMVSVIFSLDKIASARELYKYISGILLFCIGISLRMGEKEKIVRCLLLSALIISLFAAYQYFFGFKHLLEYISRQRISASYLLNDYITRRRAFFPFVANAILG